MNVCDVLDLADDLEWVDDRSSHGEFVIAIAKDDRLVLIYSETKYFLLHEKGRDVYEGRIGNETADKILADFLRGD